MTTSTGKTFDDSTELIIQWGVSGLTIESPNIETLSEYLARKAGTFTPLDKESALAYMKTFKASQRPNLEFFGGTWPEFEEYRKNLPIVVKTDKGLLTDDIVLLHTSILELINHYVMWLPYNQLGEKVRLKLVVETMIKYNLELVNKDFNPDFVINARDRGVLITALTLVKDTYPKHWALITPIFKLEAEATPDEVWDEYEKIMETIHSSHSTPDLTGSGIGQGI